MPEQRYHTNVNSTPESVHRPAMNRLRDQDVARPVAARATDAATDDLLDEIDAVLEDASEVLVNYVCKGGE